MKKKSISKRLSKDVYENMTIEQLKYLLVVRGENRRSYTDKIRQLNRTWNNDLVHSSCQMCGYCKHVELAHLKSIVSYSENSYLKEINSPDNILVLCPNCHWEYDNGLLKLEDIPIRNKE